MLEFQQKKKLKKWIYSPWVLGILFILLLAGVNAVWGIYGKEAMSRQNLVEAERSLARLKERQGILTREVDRLATPEGIEEEIRSKFSVIKDGEQVAIIVEASKTPTPIPEAPKSETFWEKLTRWFR